MKNNRQNWKFSGLIVLLVFLIGILDWSTGYELSFFVFYFIPVSLAAWFLGSAGSFLIAILSSLVWFGAVLLTGHRYSSTFIAVWEPAIRFVSYASIGWGVIKLKNALEIRKTTIEQLRASIVQRNKTERSLRELTGTLEQRVSERTRMVEARAKQLQTLAMELIESEERERRRFSELLHDDLQQLLSAALLQVNAGSERLPRAHELEFAQRLLKDALGKTRSLSHELSPAVLRHSGLVAGLKWLASQMREKFDLQVRLAVGAELQLDYSPVQVFIYRAVQELLFNITKHAGVKCAEVNLSSTAGELIITVSDEGRGFDPAVLDDAVEKAGFGLLSIRERARYIGGGLEIESAQGRGSRFTLKVPLRPEVAAATGATPSLGRSAGPKD